MAGLPEQRGDHRLDRLITATVRGWSSNVALASTCEPARLGLEQALRPGR